MIYIMTCGCRLEKSELKKTNKCSNCCPKHKKEGRIKYIEKKCVECSTIMVLLPTKTKTKRCPICLKIHNKKAQKEINKRRTKLRRNQKKEYLENKQNILAKRKSISVKTWDCVHRNECLSITQPIDQYLPCYKCNKYCSMVINTNLKETNNKNYLRNNFEEIN